MSHIPVAGPWITQKEIDYVTDAVTNSWYADAQVYHLRFEQAFAEYLGVRFAVALPSCTSAIHLSLLALGVGPGDEVIVPDCTWIATAAPVTYVGATPVFADIDAATWCLCPNSFESLITARTKAVIPVDLYGGLPDWEPIRDVARRHKIAIIEDAAEAIGASYNTRKAGSFGDTGVFSFHGSKVLTTGEGGMVVTDREDLYRRMLVLRDHGRQPGDKMFCNTEVAYKYKMTAMQAALGLAQLERLEELIERKKQQFGWYRQRLSEVPGVTLNPEFPGVVNTFWMTTIILDQCYHLDKLELIEKLAAKDIDSRPFFHPLSALPAYSHLPQAQAAREQNSIAYCLSPRGVNLPSSLRLTRSEVDYVCNQLSEILANRTRSEPR